MSELSDLSHISSLLTGFTLSGNHHSLLACAHIARAEKLLREAVADNENELRVQEFTHADTAIIESCLPRPLQGKS